MNLVCKANELNVISLKNKLNNNNNNETNEENTESSYVVIDQNKKLRLNSFF